MDKETTQPADTPEGDGTAREANPSPAHPRALEGRSGDNLSPEERFARAKADADKYLNNWHRAEADFQNYKRRTEQERDELRRFGNVSMIINLLPVLDDFERAFGSLDSRLAGLSWFDGILLIYRKLNQLLENNGVTPIQTDGQTFDPRYHEAVAHVDGEEGKVISEVQRGYKLHDRVLRPAMVVVGKGKPEDQGAGSQEQGEPNDEPQS